MAQVIAPEVWQEGINDNRLLPNRCTNLIFTGSGCNIANNPGACRVWDIQISDYITDYDDRRLNGLAGPGQNTHGADGWGASAYGVFQDVRFDSRVYTMGRHRSIAMRIFDEMQYAGEIGNWGNETMSNVITPGQSLMKTAATLSKARDLWQKQVLGPDIDKYNLFAILNGHMTGRWVPSASYVDQIMDGDASHGQWVAQPGMVEGQALPPRFAAIKGIEWDESNVPLMLQNIKVTWNDLFIPQDNRVICIDPFYEYALLSALTGGGVPVTDSAYADMQNGSFTRLMGWEFNFEIPSYYWPKLYFDNNLNVVHSAAGDMISDQAIISFAAPEGDDKLLREMLANTRMTALNYVRTDWVSGTGFVKTINNYALGMPATVGWYAPTGDDTYGTTRVQVAHDTTYHAYETATGNVVNAAYGATVAAADPTNGTNGVWVDGSTDYPWYDYGGGIGMTTTQAGGPDFGDDSSAQLLQVIGCAVYKKAAQLSQEYSGMVTDEGKTRGKFTEMVMDVKYDAWVVESLSQGIIPIVDTEKTDVSFGVPVSIVSEPTADTTTEESESASV